MKLTGAAYRQLQESLADGFVDDGQLQNLTRQALDENLSTIVGQSQGIDDKIPKVITYAESADKVPALVVTAKMLRLQNEKIGGFARDALWIRPALLVVSNSDLGRSMTIPLPVRLILGVLLAIGVAAGLVAGLFLGRVYPVIPKPSPSSFERAVNRARVCYAAACMEELSDRFHEASPKVSEWKEIGVVAFQTDRLIEPYPGGTAALAMGGGYRLGVIAFKVVSAAGAEHPRYEAQPAPPPGRSPVTLNVPSLAPGERFLLLISVQIPTEIYAKTWESSASAEWKAVKDLIDLPRSEKDLPGMVNLRAKPG